MKKTFLGFTAILLLGTVILAGCDSNNSEQKSEVGVANPASVYCEENGGTLIPTEDDEGNQYAFCQIDEDTICEEWEYYRGECPVEHTNSVEEINSDENFTNEEIVAGDAAPAVVKMRLYDNLTKEEKKNKINEICADFGGVWEDGSCVLENGKTIEFWL